MTTTMYMTASSTFKDSQDEIGGVGLYNTYEMWKMHMTLQSNVYQIMNT